MSPSAKDFPALMAQSRAPTDNPCVRNCCLDDHDVCLGCGRTLVEITGWTRLSKEEREKVLIEAAKRKEDRSIW